MINFYKTINNALIEIDCIQHGCWVSVIEPTDEEIRMLIEDYGIDNGFVRSSLDEEESSRVELEETQTLRITSYNVCYTKLLRNPVRRCSSSSSAQAGNRTPSSPRRSR